MSSTTAVVVAPDAPAHARAAGLRYVSDGRPGIRRRRAGRGFAFVDARGRRVRDDETLARIRALAIPPAWTDVWICEDPEGHLQATGRDVRGRKQYRYHAKWRKVRDEAKYERVARFAQTLPRIRARVERDLARRGLPREKAVAAVVRLLETTFARVGNSEYAKQNRSYGLTTIHNDHAEVRGDVVRLRFRGKSGKMHDVETQDPRVARIVKRCQSLAGQELFCYQDEEGNVRDLTSTDVNEYLRETTGEDFTAKDYRTWAGTMLAALALARTRDAPSKRRAAAAIKDVAAALGNTPAVCRRCYVHPGVVDAYLEGELPEPTEAGVLALLTRDL